jgi:hypothetical protein
MTVSAGAGLCGIEPPEEAIVQDGLDSWRAG